MQPQSNNQALQAVPEFIGMMSLKDLAEILIKHHGITEGLFNAAVEFSIGVGEVGPSPESVLPGAMLGVSRVGLAKVVISGPNTVDASVANPTKKPRPRANNKN